MLELMHENWIGLAVVAACLVPLVVLLRRYTFPIIGYLVEFCTYVVGMHALVWGVVFMARWFKRESSFRAVSGEPVDPGWATPWANPHLVENYDPEWLFYFELALVAVIAFAMIRYRPMAIQRPEKERERLTMGRAPRSGYSGSSRAMAGGGKRLSR
jgi:hypothetical protein